MCTILRALRPLRACVRWAWGSEPFREAIGERSCLAANAGRGSLALKSVLARRSLVPVLFRGPERRSIEESASSTPSPIG